MGRLDQAIATLKTETKRLEKELSQVAAAIAALQGASNDGRGITARLSGRTLSASARKRIAAAQKARWAKWRAAQRKRAA
jgi:kynureninase